MKENLKENKGITLIALIITIIILLILAVVSINIVMNEGLISKTEKATKIYTDSQELEGVNLAIADAKIANNGGEVTLENLKKGLDNQFGTGNYIFSSEVSPFKFVIKKGTGLSYVVYSDGHVKKEEDAREILEKYALKGSVLSNDVYVFDNNNLAEAYDAILANYGKTVETTDYLTAIYAVNQLKEAYKLQEGINMTALENALNGHCYVSHDGKQTYYSSEFEFEHMDELIDATINGLTEEEKAQIENDETGSLATIACIKTNRAYRRYWQIQNANSAISHKTMDNHIIINDSEWSTSEENYNMCKEILKAVFPGGWITGDTIKYETSADNTISLRDLISTGISIGRVERIQDNTDMSQYIQINTIDDGKHVITDENREEIKRMFNGKFVIWYDPDEVNTKAGILIVNQYIINLEKETACYVDNDGIMIEGNY